MPRLIDKETEKKAFRAGYECASISMLEIPKSRIEYERYKFTINYVIRDIYIFLMGYSDDDIFGEYMDKSDGENNYVNSELSPEYVDNALKKVFRNHPKIIHAYFLSKVCHFFMFGIRKNLVSITPMIESAFDNLLNIHKEYEYWPYPLELRKSLYMIYGCVDTNTLPPHTIIRHLYACLAEIYHITIRDLLNTVGNNIPAMLQYFWNLFPLEYQKFILMPWRCINAIAFDDSFAFYVYLKNTNPKLLEIYTNRFLWMLILPLEIIERKYKRLSNLEKIKYVNLASSVTPEETSFVTSKISPKFERYMMLKRGFLDAHELR